MRVNWQQERDPNQLLRFTGQGKNEGFAVTASDFRFARAQDNYVALYYVKAGHLKSELLRTTLAEISETTGYPGLIRCHRSYLVNLKQVHSFTEGHPLQLTLRDVPDPIRVSRSYREAVLSRLRPASIPA
nr:LytTR family DNA-binding domain-containing protein [Robiginitalea sp. SC105]